jgi:hypothetical protein
METLAIECYEKYRAVLREETDVDLFDWYDLPSEQRDAFLAFLYCAFERGMDFDDIKER